MFIQQAAVSGVLTNARQIISRVGSYFSLLGRQGISCFVHLGNGTLLVLVADQADA